MASARSATHQVLSVNKVPGGWLGELSDTSPAWANRGDAQLSHLLSGKEGLCRDVLSGPDPDVVMMR